MYKKAKRRLAACIALVVIIALYIWGYSVQTVKYNVSSDKIDSSLRIVFISDLHNSFYRGTDQSVLMEEIEKSDPDIVLFGGDVVDQYGGVDNTLKIMKLSAQKYPCCRMLPTKDFSQTAPTVCLNTTNSVQIVSKGLARPLRMIFIPRIFNHPEFTVIEIQ